MVVPRFLENLCNPNVFHMLRAVKNPLYSYKIFADCSCNGSHIGLCEVHTESYNVDQFKSLTL